MFIESGLNGPLCIPGFVFWRCALLKTFQLLYGNLKICLLQSWQSQNSFFEVIAIRLEVTTDTHSTNDTTNSICTSLPDPGMYCYFFLILTVLDIDGFGKLSVLKK